MFYIDTNVFLRYLVFDEKNQVQSKIAKKLIEQIKAKELPAYTGILVISEIVYVLEKYYEVEKENIESYVSALISMENLNIENKDNLLFALKLYSSKNVDFEDAYTYIDMLEKEIKDIYTFDNKHFSRFDGIKIIAN